MEPRASAVRCRLPDALAARLRIPVIAAPMLHVSGPELVAAACRAGVIGAFPTLGARTSDELASWFDVIERDLAEAQAPVAPYCPNLVMQNDRVAADARLAVRRGAEMVITSVGSPAPILPLMRDAGVLVFADVATLQHARKAIDAGADGLVLLTAGAGGQTGWLNPLAFVRAVRAMFDGPIVLAGGISDGVALRAALTLGCDLAYMGTRFIAAAESRASDAYRAMLVDSDMDGVVLTRAITGLPTSILAASVTAAGLDPSILAGSAPFDRTHNAFSEVRSEARPRRWRDIWSAGHSVSGVRAVQSVAQIVAAAQAEFEGACA